MFLSFSCDTLVSMTSYTALYPGGGGELQYPGNVCYKDGNLISDTTSLVSLHGKENCP